MLQQLKLEIKTPEGITPHSSFGSLLHGVIMQRVTGSVARHLHGAGLREYSQYLLPISNNKAIWTITALNRSASEEVLHPLADPQLNSFQLEHKGFELCVLNRELRSLPGYREMAEAHYLRLAPVFKHRIYFRTPTTFKLGGRYQMLPTPELIYRNALNRWNAFAEGVSLSGEEIPGQLAEHTEIVAYSLQSAVFHLGGIRIPAFIGWIDLAVRGPSELARIAGLLFAYTELSGIGIKTALGMGGIQWQTRLR